ncbi:alpha/beta hydrolase [Deinococcus sp. Marseille-Q6407]|uniref:alpha/beta hydrolase n=1 Tax=Deinococcus sp. Marseille-Q6407 TaxID=2969223 RepID=UPI0021BF6E49|nr:alpha/beta hydrolase [Deinococcus sp. Marseille-Q6407]
MLRRFFPLALALLAGFGLGTLRPLLSPAPLVLGQDAVSSPQSHAARVTLERQPVPFVHIQPPVSAAGQVRTLLVLYPGGLVRPQAYEWLGRALASEGVETVIPVFPLDLAVTGAGRAGPLIEALGGGKQVVLAGHSLGGVVAAQYAGQHPEQVDGLVLLAAYPPNGTDLRQAGFPVLNVLAGNDGVLDRKHWREAQARLPPHQLLELPGAVHAFFGRYGPQSGDGVPSVSRAEAEAQFLAGLREWLQRLPGGP